MRAEDEALSDAALALLALTGGRAGPVRLDDGRSDAPPTAFELEVAREARYYLEHPVTGFRDDCSGYVSAVYSASGVPMDGHVGSLWDLAVEHDTLHWDPIPRVGDLVFFDNTTDRDRDGRWNDDLTHIGLVVDVEPDGTAVIAHGGTSRGRVLTRMNLLSPSTYKDGSGRVLNAYLREPRPYDPPYAGYLTGELWVAFAHVDPDQSWLDLAPWSGY